MEKVQDLVHEWLTNTDLNLKRIGQQGLNVVRDQIVENF